MRHGETVFRRNRVEPGKIASRRVAGHVVDRQHAMGLSTTEVDLQLYHRFATGTDVPGDLAFPHMLDFDIRAQVGLLTWIYRGGVTIHEIDVKGLSRIIELTEKYQAQPIDLADATLVVAAEETGLREILSIDRDFLVYRTKEKHVIENVFVP
jgi:predicted nucleic acid-binding protein